MYYKKVETYSFAMPREYKSYTQFKEDLKEAGVIFTESGSTASIVITIANAGRFSTEDKQWTLECIS